MSTQKTFSWLPVRELVKDAAGAYSGLYLFKGMHTANHHIILYIVADTAYVYMLRGKLLPKIFSAPPPFTSDGVSLDMTAANWTTIFTDYGAKILFTMAVDVGWEWVNGRDAFLKKIGYILVMNVGGFVVNQGANYIDSMLPVSMEGYINS